MPSHQTCCVVNCKNTGSNSNCRFYSFPRRSWKWEQRIMWINAVNRKNPDGTQWFPNKKGDKICSAHFIGGKKAEESSSPSYVPTIFHSKKRKPAKRHLLIVKKVDEAVTLARPIQNMDATSENETSENVTLPKVTLPPSFIKTEAHNKEVCAWMEPDNDALHFNFNQSLKIDQECQVNIFFNIYKNEKNFICNRYIYGKECDVEIQTDILIMDGIVKIPNNRKFKDKGCATEPKLLRHNWTQTDSNKYLNGISSIITLESNHSKVAFYRNENKKLLEL